MDIKIDAIGSYVNGSMVLDGNRESVLSPVDGTTITNAFVANRNLIHEAVESSQRAFDRKWLGTSLSERQELLGKLAALIQERSGDYSEIESLNTGKTLRQSMMMDIPLGISHVEYFANTKEFKLTRNILHPEFPNTKGIIEHAPMGVVGAITPWNVPFLMAVWKIAPAVLAGNTVVIKPSINTPLSTLELAKDAIKAGFPEGVINVIIGNGGETGEALCKDENVAMVSFTGSTETGKKIMHMVSDGIKRVTLELGGKSPNVVMEDADLDHAAKGVLFGIFLNSGQLCESGSRLIVHKKVRKKLVDKITKYLDQMKAGNPMDMETDISAITTREQLHKIESMVQSGITDSTDLIYRKNISDLVPEHGLYYPPTIVSISDFKKDVFREEIFGPVLAISEFETEDEAVQIANSTEYGLAAGVWSRNIQTAKHVASQIQAGTVWINDYHLLSAAAPRGGFKKSGIGRELGLEGILEYTQTRHIFVNKKESELDRVAYGLLIPE